MILYYQQVFRGVWSDDLQGNLSLPGYKEMIYLFLEADSIHFRNRVLELNIQVNIVQNFAKIEVEIKHFLILNSFNRIKGFLLILAVFHYIL